MSENKKYTIVVKRQRVEVSEAVYRAYHKAREAERYQKKCIKDNEYSLERFQEDGVNAEYRIVHVQPDIVETLIQQELLQALYFALRLLSPEERTLIEELFFNEKSERNLALELGIANMTLHDRKHRILKKLKKLLEN